MIANETLLIRCLRKIWMFAFDPGKLAHKNEEFRLFGFDQSLEEVNFISCFVNSNCGQINHLPPWTCHPCFLPHYSNRASATAWVVDVGRRRTAGRWYPVIKRRVFFLLLFSVLQHTLRSNWSRRDRAPRCWIKRRVGEVCVLHGGEGGLCVSLHQPGPSGTGD